MNHPFCSSKEGNPLSDGSSLPGTLEWKNATLQTMHLFIAPLLWLECLRHVVDEELGKVLQTIDILKWLSQAFNHSSWLWCIQELHKTESRYQLIQNANPTTAARATNTKKKHHQTITAKAYHWNEKTGGQTPKRHRFFLGKLMPMTTCQETLAPRNIEHHATGRQQPEVIWELGYPRVWLYVQWQ